MLPKRVHWSLATLAVAQTSLLFFLALARFANVHHRTFDLALYARVAWGVAHGDAWSPVLDSHVLGAHISPVLVPLGLVGRWLGTVPTLLFAQALAVALCLWPIARIGARHMGMPGIWLGAAAWLLYPNLGHVATYEFHPGTLAVLPLCWAYDALDRRKLSALCWAIAGVLACREDFGIACVLLALLFAAQARARDALLVGFVALAYTAFASWVTFAWAPKSNSFSAHFAVWGGAPWGVFRALFEDPARVWAHFGERDRLLYVARLLAPLSFFSLRKPAWLVPVLPFVGINLVSAFPTTLAQYSHYLTPAVPAIVASGLVGVSDVRVRFVRVLGFVTLGISHVAMAGLPLSRDFERAAFAPDQATQAARAVLARIPPEASVQAPDALLPQLAERKVVRRAPPPEAFTDYVVLDVSHRQRFAGREDLLRTSEEPLVRRWLARSDHGTLVYEPPYLLLQRALDPRRAPAVQRYFAKGSEVGEDETTALSQLTDCLSVRAGTMASDQLTLTLKAHGACPPDLALHLSAGPGGLLQRTVLLFDGALSLAHLRAGDGLRSVHTLSPSFAAAVRARGLWVGALRSSGARPRPTDPSLVQVPLTLAP